MGFETPLLLLALAAAGLPIAAHLLRRRDLPVRKLPTIALLRRAQASSKRRMRLVDLLLLITRVLIVGIAALAIAGPLLRLTLPYGDGSVASVVLVIDDSMSMTGRGDPPLFEAALERAHEVVESLPAGSEVAIVMAGSPARVALSRTDDAGAGARALRAIARAQNDGARGTDLSSALERAERELAGARHGERRVLVLTDLAAHTSASEMELPTGLDVRFESMAADADDDNVRVTMARATPDPTTPGRASIAVEVAASEAHEGATFDVVVRRGGDEIARDRVEIDEGHGRLTLHAAASETDAGAWVEIEGLEDALAMDDRRGLLLRRPTGVRVLVVRGGRRGDARFLDRALDLVPDAAGSVHRRTVDPDTFATTDLSGVDVLILADTPAPDAGVAGRVVAFVEAGGGLLVAPGERFEPRGYVARLGSILPATPRAAAASAIEGPSLAEGATLLPAAGLERTQTRRRIGFDAIESDATRELSFADGSPALLLRRAGEGRVAMLATTLEADWTNLPYRPGYLPLLTALVRHLAPQVSSPDAALPSGEPFTLRAPAGATRLLVHDPSGAELTLEDGPNEGEHVIADTRRPGVYRVQIASREAGLHPAPALAFLVAAPPEESNLRAGAAPQVAEPEEDAPTGSVVERPIAAWLFFLVGWLAVLEGVLRLRGPGTASR